MARYTHGRWDRIFSIVGPCASILSHYSHASLKARLPKSILKRAREDCGLGRPLLTIVFHDLRQFGLGKYHQVDNSPYGGGAGMLMRADVVVSAIEASLKN